MGHYRVCSRSINFMIGKLGPDDAMMVALAIYK